MQATQNLDFSKLDLRDALDLAILVEEEAKERYGEFADSLELHHTPAAARFFRFMLGNEAKHEEALTARRTARFGTAPRRVTREMLFDVEAPEFYEPRVHMTARQALEVALRAEKKAYDFFGAALAKVADADVRALFVELQREEQEHAALVEKQIAKLEPEDPGDIRDYEDPPVEQ